LKLQVFQLDVKSTFLNGELEEEGSMLDNLRGMWSTVMKTTFTN